MNIETLQKFCKSLPGVTEDIKWEKDLCFLIGGKMFCVASMDDPFTFSFKVTDEEFETLSVLPGFAPAPYMARAKWVLVTAPSKVKLKEIENYIRQSYKMIAGKLTKELKLE